ncbi:DUF4296 domain-containing protein [Kaistella jeonii]|uniref:DUF4296 domain-containing protein n=1 Tax=Kaistella jeonii TaxID=266749 RepID=A0A0C1FA50_9FLAO|nr:DUF4296 domain-containing protein [Kaistella jeonii]KIA90022.1 hypothetical protein OA86_05345 [Kaistella jeonii]SFB79065.1 protein of unknown function [Kaistella jeonii]VEI96289.1 Uncharacterised protein [Kaistella jeonii]
MKKYLLIIFSLLMSCTQLIDPPKNLIPKDKISEIVAEFAMNDQINTYVPGSNLENATRMALKQRNIKSADFIQSYKYYIATGELEKIMNDAQEIILTKDPSARDYIDKKLKENKNTPLLVK